MRVGHYDLSISLVSNGYIYIHFLQDFFPNSNACVYTGDHITIAPTGKTHIHFHITNITYQMNNGYITYASSYNTSFCSLNIKDVTNVFSNSSITTKDKKEWLSHAACVNEYNVSFNKTPVDILDYDMDTFDIIFRLFLRGFSA
jgi:hypothetical protein